MDGRNAIAALEAAFAARALVDGDRPLVGIFGNGLPHALVAAAGLSPVDVKSAPDHSLGRTDPAVASVLEPFLDDYSAIFINRLFLGDFDGLVAIVFPRDDAAALTAYQYSLELRREGCGRAAPKLLLWNLVHGTSPAISAFNAQQAERLAADLRTLGGHRDPSSIEKALTAERDRATALTRLDALLAADAPAISGGEAMRWRNAGRYLEAGRHASLLTLACDEVDMRPARRQGRRIGLIGAALDDPRVYAAIEAFGTIVADVQPFGRVWPSRAAGAPSLSGLVAAEAASALVPRARPEAKPLDAIVAELVGARCTIAVAQIDQNDDSFGWDLPGLRRRLAGRGIPLIDLGFRDHRPAGGWLAEAGARLAAAMETEHA